MDALRGFALFGILAANLYSFMGYNTYSPEEIINLAFGDRAVLFLIDCFVEGKFYGIFSILFGFGFALQAERFQQADANFKRFWRRRMLILIGIGLLHMFFVWNGDILTLYGFLGLFLPLFLSRSDRSLLWWIGVLLTIPVLIHLLLYFTPDASFWGSMSRLSTDLKAQWGYGEKSLLEMRTSDLAIEVFSINVLKAIPRPMSYLISGRYFQVLGLFLIGLLLARTWIPQIRKPEITTPSAAIWLGVIGLVCSFGYAVTKWIAGSAYSVDGFGLFQGFIYHLGSSSLALGIAMLIVKLWASGRMKAVFGNLALLGRMALTNYILQNVTAIFLFFGYGLALMRKLPFVYLPLFALGILTLQWFFSRAWLSRFRQGPLEYLWRKLSYR